MGLFGFVKKAIGKVAKIGLGQVTGGLSNNFFDYVDSRKKQQHLKPIVDQMFDVRPNVRGGARPRLREGFNFQKQYADTGESPGERAERIRRVRLANLKKAQLKRRALDVR